MFVLMHLISICLLFSFRRADRHSVSVLGVGASRARLTLEALASVHAFEFEYSSALCDSAS